MGRVALRVVLAAVLLVACSDDDDGGGGGGDLGAFCEELETLGADASVSQEDGFERLQDLDPPDAIEDDWNLFVETMVGQELPEDIDQERASEALYNVSDYVIEECGIDLNT